jgi:small subunit ribosomal protein S3
MGQKVHPKGIRLGYIIKDRQGNVSKARDWDSKWFNLRDMPALIEEDQKIRRFLKDRLKLAAVSRIGIERTGKYLAVTVYTARPGIVIGKKGSDIEGLKAAVDAMTGRDTKLQIKEIKKPELDAQLVAEGVALQLEKQVSFRRAMKRAIERTMQAGALGIKVRVSGRLGGAEIARTEWLKEGRVPLQTFRADIDYGFTEAHITMGRIGVKVWIFQQEHYKESHAQLMEEVRSIEKERMEELARQAEETPPEPGILPVGPEEEVDILEEEVLKELSEEEQAARRRPEVKGKE